MPVAADLYFYSNQEEETKTPPLVLIHGAGGSHLNWPPEVRRLPGYHILAPDLPGHGKSEGRGQQSVAAYSRILVDWLASLGIFGAIFVGHSMGGGIALELAIHYPDHVLGLGLVSTGARLRVNPELLANVANPTTFLSVVNKVTEWSFSPSADPRLVELSARRLAEIRPSVLQGDFLACDTFDVSGLLGSIQQPALVLCGSDDRMTPMRSSQMLAGAIPSAHLEVLPGCGHMLPLEQPEAVAEALKRFLPSIPFGL